VLNVLARAARCPSDTEKLSKTHKAGPHASPQLLQRIVPELERELDQPHVGETKKAAEV